MDSSRLTLIMVGVLASVIAAGAIIVQTLSSAVGAGDNQTSMDGEEPAISESGQTISAADETGENVVVKQGTLSSPGEEGGPFQVIDILPPREDGKAYVGTISFTATRPIFVAPLQTYGVGNETLDLFFGDLLVYPGVTTGTLIAPAIITPEYSVQIESQIPIPETFSASVPFAGSGLSIGNLNGEPFLVSYTLHATVHTAEVEENVESAITDEVEVNGTRVSIVVGSAAQRYSL